MLAYERGGGDDARRVVANVGDEAVEGSDGGGDQVVELATSAGREGQPFDGRIAGTEALVLRPSGLAL